MKSNTLRASLALASLFAVTSAFGASLTQGFDDVPGLATAGWKFSNQSTLASTNTWRQGSGLATGAGPAQSGAATSYAIANYTDTSSTAATGATISNWMVTPILAFNGVAHTVSFYTRTGTGASFPDRLQVLLSKTTNDTGTSPTDVGAFTTTLLTVNPNLLSGPTNYPDVFTQYTINIAANVVPTNGYLAFRYFVTDGGTNGPNSSLIGVDTLSVQAVPEPSVLAALGLGAAAMLRRRKRA